jgi:AcrR family transcriptional regulator
MPNSTSTDPRARRTRTALQASFKDLLQTKPYQKITISELAERAGIARHTFYNHYETKDDLLHYMVDSVLDEFFSNLGNWDFFLADPQQELKMHTAFFQAWKDNAEVVDLLRSVNIDIVIIERLKIFFTQFYYDRVIKDMPAIDLTFANYVISFNAYSLLGLLIPWFESGLKQKPEDLAGFLIQLTGSKQRRKAVERYFEIFME